MLKKQVAAVANNESKMDAIKIIKETAKLDLKQSKELAENGGTINVSDFETAEEIKNTLVENGINASIAT